MQGSSAVAGDRLRSLVERIERIEEEIKGLNDDKKDISWKPRARAST